MIIIALLLSEISATKIFLIRIKRYFRAYVNFTSEFEVFASWQWLF